ncbi:unnamed protein product [Polarella glacialis]|uniref:Uncharacterized protein n=1 Tax=Polarella glacialis TaxID=89957 RepID=A0A813IVN5_POLGL|nr:unnamed protein product [Polarella glacialis]CAE8631648.1 unnamed protein product [Polarella glacialis]CAE8657709.1 unnamed protein product [Polarella glacialis]
MPSAAQEFCPLGEDGGSEGLKLSCYNQAILVVFVFIVTPLLCCTYCCWRNWCRQRTPKLQKEHGRLKKTAACGDFSKEHGRLNFKVTRAGTSRSGVSKANKGEARHEEKTSAESSARSFAGVTSEGGGGEEGEGDGEGGGLEAPRLPAQLPCTQSRHSLFSVRGRIHVVWDVNLQNAQEWLAGKRGSVLGWSLKKSADQSSMEECPPNNAAEECPPNNAAEECPPTNAAEELQTAAGCNATDDALAIPAYADHQRVEYYSATHGVWLLGEVTCEVVALKAPGSDLPRQQALYTVTVHRTSQPRPQVGLDCMRQPLDCGEPVEVWLAEAEEWMPACCLRMEASSTAIRDYRIRMAGSTVERREPSAMLRRRFPPGSSVLVYRGLELGWVPAFVAPETVPVEKDEPAVPLWMEELRQMGDTGPQVERAFLKSNGTRLDYWVLVPVLATTAAQTENLQVGSFPEDSISSGQVAEFVPSYLVRFHPEYMFQGADKQVMLLSL